MYKDDEGSLRRKKQEKRRGKWVLAVVIYGSWRSGNIQEESKGSGGAVVFLQSPGAGGSIVQLQGWKHRLLRSPKLAVTEASIN